MSTCVLEMLNKLGCWNCANLSALSRLAKGIHACVTSQSACLLNF